MPSRRPHLKTRHGCLTCKRRKVRCDLVRPICGHCERLQLECSFPQDSEAEAEAVAVASNVTSSECQQVTSNVTNRMESSTSTIQSTTTLNVLDLELMYHYCNFTSLTMVNKPHILPTWQYNVPQHAFSYPFLLHGLLALSALHLRDTYPLSPRAAEYGRAATRHQSAALAGYIPLLNSMNPENVHALFAFSAVIAAISYGFLVPELNPHTSEDLIESILRIFELLIGSTVVAVRGKAWLKQGDLTPLMDPPKPLETYTDSHLSEDLRQALDALMQDINSRSWYGGLPVDVENYTMAMRYMYLAFPDSMGQKAGSSQLFGWPVFLLPDYLTALRGRDAIALVILAYYGAALHYGNYIWCLKGLGAQLVHAVSELVGDEWQGFLAWPLNCCEQPVGA